MSRRGEMAFCKRKLQTCGTHCDSAPRGARRAHCRRRREEEHWHSANRSWEGVTLNSTAQEGGKLSRKGLQLKGTWIQQTTLSKAFKVLVGPGPKSLRPSKEESLEMGVEKMEPSA
jgi:hypothetical protein